jgi:hypothetical protein
MYLGGSSHGLINMLFWHFPEGTKEKHKNYQSVGVLAEI